MAVAKKKAVTKKAVKKSTVKKAAVKKKAVTKKAVKKVSSTTKKSVAKKVTTKKAVAKKAVSKKAVTKKVTAKKTAVKQKATTVKTPAPVTKTNTTVTTAKSEKKPARSKRPAPPTATQGGFAPYIEKKGEEYMNEPQTAHFIKILEAWKTELMEEVDRTVHHMQDEAANFPDPNDRASQESEFALELRARDRERKLIKKIDESVNNLKNEDYGYCNICGIEIGIRRLEARPTASLCIDCKTLDEIREKQIRG
ncbi:MAG: RNA polymerase-binding protein DksA [Gammaproteobacteria bacterium]|nr:RNA polymerase-binding protein DksA [Gammaproteobacteria bacterium]